MEPQHLAVIVAIITLGVGVLGWVLKWMSGRFKEFNEAMEGIASRLTERVSAIEKNVVYKDVFDQFKETTDVKHDLIRQMMELLQEQQKTTSTQNSTEHARICGKMDAIPQLIKEEITNTVKLLRP